MTVQSPRGLKTRATLLVALSAFLFCAAYWLDAYVQGRRAIIRRGTDAQVRVGALAVKALNAVLGEYRSELRGLGTQFGSGSRDDMSDLAYRMATLIQGDAGLYQELGFLPGERAAALRVRPEGVFEGGVGTVVDSVFELNGSAWARKDGSLTPGMDAVCLSHRQETGGLLWARVGFDRWVGEALNRLYLPPEMTASVVDSLGFIRFDARPVRLKRPLAEAYPNIILKEEVSAWPITGVHPELLLVLHLDDSGEWTRLNAGLRRIAGTSVLLLIGAIAVVWVAVGRYSAPLEEIRRVTGRVAEGDFSQTLRIRRRDEIGLLIDGFNAMVSRIDASYTALKQANAQLEAQYLELKETRQKLSEKERLAVIGETVSKISHEIQNRIGAVSIWVQNLEAATQGQPDLTPCVEEIRQALDRFMALLTGFKRFYRYPELHRSVTDLEAVLAKLFRDHEAALEEKGLSLALSVTPAPFPLQVDAHQLEEALINLLLNAIYYAPVGSEIVLTLRRLPPWAVLTMSDQGPGLAEAILNTVFHPFTTTKPSGSGLGLAMVKRIAEAHGGRVEAENGSPGGAVFRLYFPLA